MLQSSNHSHPSSPLFWATHRETQEDENEKEKEKNTTGFLRDKSNVIERLASMHAKRKLNHHIITKCGWIYMSLVSLTGVLFVAVLAVQAAYSSLSPLLFLLRNESTAMPYDISLPSRQFNPINLSKCRHYAFRVVQVPFLQSVFLSIGPKWNLIAQIFVGLF